MDADNGGSKRKLQKPNDHDDDDDDESPVKKVLKRETTKFEDKRSRHCPYLDTINRAILDFDFEKLCSISLSHLNVYACLVCGKYFQGRGSKSHAYTHSVLDGHHVYLNLETRKFYCLPDNYEIIDSSLADITYVLNPTFTLEEIRSIDENTKMSRAFDNTTYLPGIVGLNNIKANDYCNVILQALSHVPALRNYFLREENYINIKRPPGDQSVILVQRLGELIRKLWNPKNFKAHVSPHEMLQAVVLCSKKQFQITKQGDAIEVLSWILHSLHRALNGTKKQSSSIISKTFQGKMRVYSKKVVPVELTDAEKNALMEQEDYQETVSETPFFYLTCDLPAPPLYPDDLRENIIPQVPLSNILSKFNGVLEKEISSYKDSLMRRYEILALPKYLILFIKRFTKNRFHVEKNPTIVNFPIKNIDFGELLSPEVRSKYPNAYYNVIANIIHDGEPAAGKGSYRCHILHKGTSKWFEMQDLHVSEVLPQMITLSESYIQIWELQQSPQKSENGEEPKNES